MQCVCVCVCVCVCIFILNANQSKQAHPNNFTRNTPVSRPIHRPIFNFMQCPVLKMVKWQTDIDSCLYNQMSDLCHFLSHSLFLGHPFHISTTAKPYIYFYYMAVGAYLQELCWFWKVERPDCVAWPVSRGTDGRGVHPQVGVTWPLTIWSL